VVALQRRYTVLMRRVEALVLAAVRFRG